MQIETGVAIIAAGAGLLAFTYAAGRAVRALERIAEALEERNRGG